jgi:hypothetical protein
VNTTPGGSQTAGGAGGFSINGFPGLAGTKYQGGDSREESGGGGGGGGYNGGAGGEKGGTGGAGATNYYFTQFLVGSGAPTQLVLSSQGVRSGNGYMEIYI